MLQYQIALATETFPKRDVTNIFLFNALIGSGLYILNRKHLTNTSTSTRIVYSGVGSILFTFGSVLLWAVVRSWLPKSVPLCATFGLGSGIFLLKVGRDYLDLVDSRCTGVA
uniref:Uncharacterized protein n=1 Tax=Timema douglasi TaxID=61478 RepID=A0A7R8ZAN6_TIMDO|nr:unnamed protein product [Timema douglasi]